MKIIGWSLAVLITIPVSFLVLFMIVQTLASERVEVVALHTLDAKGETITTRIWVADHDGYQYLGRLLLRHGAGWKEGIDPNRAS